MTSARTLADITDERVVPVDYLGVLMLLFLLLVLDRLFYTLGLHLGKVPLNAIFLLTSFGFHVDSDLGARSIVLLWKATQPLASPSCWQP